MESKVCCRCRKRKLLAHFHKSKHHHLGVHAACILCAIKYSRKHYKKNKNKALEYAKERFALRSKWRLCVSCGIKIDHDTDKKLCSRCLDKRWISRRNRRNNLKLKIFKVYGDACKCCGEKNTKFLTIDHINNNGTIQRKMKKVHNTHKWIIENNFPKDIQILCWNCNLGKNYNGGICPHKESVIGQPRALEMDV